MLRCPHPCRSLYSRAHITRIIASSASSLSMHARYPTYDISGRVVLITGASAGFGEAIAWRCADLGAKLILLARSLLPCTSLFACQTCVEPIPLLIADAKNA